MVTIPEQISLDDITAWAPPGSCKSLSILRLDLIHPVVSGNKWFKLKYQLAEALRQGKKTIVTFGGGYSNHLIATAYAAKEHGLRAIGIVRGHYSQPTPTLLHCTDLRMELRFVSRRQYDQSSTAGLYELSPEFPDAFIIPEGGANDLGIRGAAEIAQFLPADANYVCVAVGSGTTLAGLQSAIPDSLQLHGFCAARNCEQAFSLINRNAFLRTPVMHQMIDPRFGKWTDKQLSFMRDFLAQTGIPLDVVYTGKMMMRLAEMLACAYFPPDANIVCIHTGGLQGNPAGCFN